MPFLTGYRRPDTAFQAAIGLAVPGEALFKDRQSFKLAVPFAGEQRARE